ncbi:MAG: class I SAM-dependent methyltransferase [Cyclobacterium sp.]|uniref:class I SAM-dependent methyltransferase n=1 Tax=unclassified Cyclobacterium TaxID=2615055 RepID=UPI0013CF4F5F|nr:class I SAM-dependent methyltransferase [Cyclobacterium sp. SYSU L10401]
MKVFEFGSGGSTKFFVTRVKEIHSVEHDELWYNLVEKEIGGFQNLSLNLTKGEDKPITTAGFISDEDNDSLDYRKYSNSISDFEDQYFDLILIDGKARNACIRNAIPKLKNGGFLIVDNSHRKSYSNTISSISNWLLFRSFGPSVNSKRFTQTSFFQKPEHGI